MRARTMIYTNGEFWADYLEYEMAYLIAKELIAMPSFKEICLVDAETGEVKLILK